MMSPENVTEPIHALWDEIADFDAASSDTALRHLLRSLCALADAQNAIWLDAVRMPDIAPSDPVHGWRPRMRRTLHSTRELDASAQEQIDMLEAGNVDITTVRNVAQAGHYRTNRLIDLVDPDWFDSAYYRVYYKGNGYADAIWAGCPVNEDVEVYFGLYRGLDRRRFNETERDTVALALRGLKWFFRQYLLSHGLLVAHSPLTPVERSVLRGLLGGQTEKEIASERSRSHHTTHDHIKSIYRKFGVANRAALMALWLGQTA